MLSGEIFSFQFVCTSNLPYTYGSKRYYSFLGLARLRGLTDIAVCFAAYYYAAGQNLPTSLNISTTDIELLASMPKAFNVEIRDSVAMLISSIPSPTFL